MGKLIRRSLGEGGNPRPPVYEKLLKPAELPQQKEASRIAAEIDRDSSGLYCYFSYNRSNLTKNSSKDIVVAGAIAVAFSVFYLQWLSKAYVFEGLIRALPIETHRFQHLFPGNYLLYGVIGLGFHGLLQTLGFNHLAVTSLQMMDCLLGAAGLFVYFMILRQLRADLFSSICWTVILGVSLGYWLWSTEAEDYIFSTLLLMINFYFLLTYLRRNQPDPVILGVLHGLAIFGHFVNIVFGTVILAVLILKAGKQWMRPVLRYVGAVTIVVGATYAIVIGCIQHPTNWHAGYQWFLGSAGVSGHGLSLGGRPNLLKIGQWLKMSVRILTSFEPHFINPPPWAFSSALLWIARLIFLAFAGALSVFHRTLVREDRQVALLCVLWIASYACIFTSWQPWTMVYRVSDLIPIGTLLFLGYRASEKLFPGAQAAAIVLAVCLGMGNLGAEVYPRSFATNNPDLERMVFIKANTQANDWITGDGGIDEIYIPYFAIRRPIVIGRYANQPQELSRLLEIIWARHESVFVTSWVLESPLWKAFFSRYDLKLRARDSHGFALYRLQSVD